MFVENSSRFFYAFWWSCVSDKGLCGGVNSAVSRLVRDTVKESEGQGIRASIIGIGDKVRSALQRVFGDRFSRIFTEVTRFPWSFATAAVIADRLIKVMNTLKISLHSTQLISLVKQWKDLSLTKMHFPLGCKADK